MPICETLHIINLTPVILKTFWSIYSTWEWTENLILGGSEAFTGGTLYSSANYELTWHMYIVYICIYLAHFIFKKNEGGRGLKQISTYKTCYEIKKISTSLLSVEGMGEGGCNFYKKNKLKSEMLKCLTTKKVDNKKGW